LLQYSRVTRTGDVQKEIQLDKVVDEIVGKIKSEKEFKIHRSVALPAMDHNPIWIENLFFHLINNAIQHHHKDKANVHIQYENKEGYHWFKVNDDGPGIPEGSKEKIFGIFQTLEARDTHESTGVGLAIVKKILEKMGGDVWVESKEGEGSSFNFRIPV
jgi:signal transduction histidine kinase